MSPTPADAPLLKVTLNLFERDVAALKAYYGDGWSVSLREIIRVHCQTFTEYQIKYDKERRARTLGDLSK